MYDKLRISWGNLKLNIICNKLGYKDRHRNIIRIKLKNEVETFSDKTEDFHLTYFCYISDKLSNQIGKM